MQCGLEAILFIEQKSEGVQQVLGWEASSADSVWTQQYICFPSLNLF